MKPRDLFFWKWLFLVFWAQQSVWAAPKQILEAYGDSLTAGMLDYTSVTEPPDFETISSILSDLATFRINVNNRTLIHKLERRELAWPQKLANRLTQEPQGVEVRNYAESGARSDSIFSQVHSALTPGDDDRVVALFFIGHNDLCYRRTQSAEVLVSQYELFLDQALNAWDAKHKGAKAFFVSVADVDKIYPVLDQLVWYQSEKGRYRCNESWDSLFFYCRSFYREFKEKKLTDFLQPRISALNGSLDKLAKRWKEKSNRNQYFYLDLGNQVEYQKEFFAIDCYHLSEKGQSTLADQIFQRYGWQLNPE